MCVHRYGRFLCRGQISKDYEQEFPSVEVGPRLVRGCSEDSQVILHRQVSVGCFFPAIEDIVYLENVSSFFFLPVALKKLCPMNHALFFQGPDSEDYWEKLAQESDPSRQQKELLNYSAIIPQLKSKMLAFKAQVIKKNLN